MTLISTAVFSTSFCAFYMWQVANATGNRPEPAPIEISPGISRLFRPFKLILYSVNLCPLAGVKLVDFHALNSGLISDVTDKNMW